MDCRNFFVLIANNGYSFANNIFQGGYGAEISIIVLLVLSVFNLVMVTPLTWQHLFFVATNQTTQELMAQQRNSNKVIILLLLEIEKLIYLLLSRNLRNIVYLIVLKM